MADMNEEIKSVLVLFAYLVVVGFTSFMAGLLFMTIMKYLVR